jgi:dTMP kinase
LKKGVFITIEGIDGSGITTHSKLLVKKLNEMGYKAVYTKEPTEGPIGALIRTFLKKRLEADPRILSLLFAADRVWHCYKDPSLPGAAGILSALNRGYVVVSDRYLYSNLAYQGKDVDYRWILEINKWAIRPDVLIYLKVDVDTALRRIKERGFQELYEEKEILTMVFKMFDLIIDEAKKENVKVIIVDEVENGRELSIQETNEIIFNEVIKLLRSINI